jgi:hypothetical protein
MTTTKVVEKTNVGVVVAIVFGLMSAFVCVGGSIYAISNRLRQKKFDRIAREIINPVHDDTPL